MAGGFATHPGGARPFPEPPVELKATSQSANLTPEQVQQLQQFLAQQAADRQAVPEPGQSAASTPWKLKVGDSELEARDATELQRLLDERDRQSQAALESERLKAQAAQQQLEEAQRQAQQQRANLTPAQQAEFDKENYAKQFLEDPRNANWYLWENDPRVKGVFTGIANKLAQLETSHSALAQEIAARRFLDTQADYVRSDKNFKAIESIIGEHNLPWTDASMGMAWAVAKERGLAELASEDGERSEQYITVPNLGGRSRSTNVEPDDVTERFSRMTAAQQKEYLENLQNA